MNNYLSDPCLSVCMCYKYLSICLPVWPFLVFRKKDLYLVITQKLTFMKSGGFHVDFIWNPPDFMRISCRFQVKSGGFHLKSAGFHEIHRISGEICRISKDQLPGMVSPMFVCLCLFDFPSVCLSVFSVCHTLPLHLRPSCVIILTFSFVFHNPNHAVLQHQKFCTEWM